MKKMTRYTALLALTLISSLIASCDNGNSNKVTPPASELVWDQTNWDEVTWQ